MTINVYHLLPDLCLCVRKDKFEPFTSEAGNRDLTSKSETVNLPVNFCVANAHSVVGFPQKKGGVIPNYCHNYTEIKYVKDVSCVGHLSSVVLVTNVPNVAIDLPVGARLHQFWKKMGSPGGKSQGGNSTHRGLHPPLPVQTQLNQVTNCHKQLCQPPQKTSTFWRPCINW